MLNSILYSYLSTYFVEQIEKEVAYLMLFINGNWITCFCNKQMHLQCTETCT